LSTLFNDVAIALFVLDVFLVIIGWPMTSPDESFAETYVAIRWNQHEGVIVQFRRSTGSARFKSDSGSVPVVFRTFPFRNFLGNL
jgi:hypothetical protein